MLTFSRPTDSGSTDVRHVSASKEDATYEDYEDVVSEVRSSRSRGPRVNRKESSTLLLLHDSRTGVRGVHELR